MTGGNAATTADTMMRQQMWQQQCSNDNSCNMSTRALAIPVALIAGLVSFFSPCVVPLLPDYISYVTGPSGADLESARRGRILAGTSLFVLGFSFVFVSAWST